MNKNRVYTQVFHDETIKVQSNQKLILVFEKNSIQYSPNPIKTWNYTQEAKLFTSKASTSSSNVT